MRVLVVDCELMGLDFCTRCVSDGHEVRWFRDPSTGREGEGFAGIQRVGDWRSHMAWAKDGLIVTTGNCKYLRELDRYRDLGFKIFSPTYASAQLEINRSAGMDAMKSVGIEVPEYTVFGSLKEAETFARKSDQAFCFKTMGDEEDKSLSYVASDPADLVGWLQRQQARGMVLRGPCMLQEKIDMLAEVGVSGWFGPDGFLPDKWQICFEHKPLMNGNIGPNTGEMGTVCQYVAEDKMASEMLEPMAPILQALGHRGDFAIGCGIDSKGRAWPFEFTCRLGWPAFFIQCASHKGDVAQWMRDLLDGEDTLKVDRRPAVGVVLAQPQFPYGKSKPDFINGNPISGTDRVWDQIHPAGMMIGMGPVMDGDKVKDAKTCQTAGEIVMVVTGLGKTVSKARESAYGAIDEIGFSDAMYRTDIGEALEKQLPKLHEFGYAAGLTF